MSMHNIPMPFVTFFTPCYFQKYMFMRFYAYIFCAVFKINSNTYVLQMNSLYQTELFKNDDGRPKLRGDKIINHKLAETFQKIR